MNHLPAGISDEALIVFSAVVVVTFIAGIVFGRWTLRLERETENNLTGGLMTPPEKDTEFPRPEPKPPRLKAITSPRKS